MNSTIYNALGIKTSNYLQLMRHIAIRMFNSHILTKINNHNNLTITINPMISSIKNAFQSVIKAVAPLVISLLFILPIPGYAVAIMCPVSMPSSPSSNWTVVGSPSGSFSAAAVVAGTGYCYYNLQDGFGFLEGTFAVNTSTLKPPLWTSKNCDEINSVCCKESPTACQFPTQQ